MKTAPAGRLGKKVYHSWTSGLVAGERAKLLAFWRGEAESIEWQVKVVNVPTSLEGRRGWSGMKPAAVHKLTICWLGADLEGGD